MKTSTFIFACLVLLFHANFITAQERIFYLKGTSAPFSIYSSNLNGTNEILIKTGLPNSGRCAVKDGKIYYFAGSSLNSINLDGTGMTVIPNTSDALADVNISPAGDKLVYAGSTNNYCMYIIDVTGANKVLFNNGQPALLHQFGASWNMPGTIFFVQSSLGNAYSQRIYSKPDNDPNAIPVQLTSTFAHEPNSGGPGNLVMFNNLAGSLVTMHPDGSNQTILTNAGTSNHAYGTWHLSDSTFYYMHNDTIFRIRYNNTGNVQISPAGGIARVIGIATVYNGIILTASDNPVCQGDTVTFTAHGTHGLPAGSLQWYVNGLPVSGGNLNNGLVAYWPFDGNANDVSGHGNNAAQVTATLTADRFGNPNSAYNFAGLTNPQIIRVPNSSSLQFTNQATFSLWVKMNSYYGMNGYGQAANLGYHVLFSKDYDQCCLYQGICGLANGNFFDQMMTNGWYSGINFYDTVPGSTIGQWYNFTWVYTPMEGRMYSNGQLLATKTGTTSFANSNSKDLYFGRLNSFWYPLNGKLDDVRFYNRALTPGEVMQIYQGYDTTFSYVPQPGDVVYCVYTSDGTPAVVDTSNMITMTVHPLPADIGQSTGNLQSLQNGLVAYYPFNGNALDGSGNGNNGTVHGATLTTDRYGNNNSAYFFNGAGTYINVPNSTSLQINTVISMCAWIDFENGGTMNPRILHKYDYQLATLSTNPARKIFSQFGNNNNSSVTSQNILQANNWHFVALTYNGSNIILYINGIQDSSIPYTGSIGISSYDLTIGINSQNLQDWFKGKIDDIRIYNRAITSQEVDCLYTGLCNPLSVSLSQDSVCVNAPVNLFISNSQLLVQYQLLKNGVNFGNPQTGTGTTLTFPITGLTQTSSFTIHATNTTTGCNIMLDSTFTVFVGQMVNATVSPNTAVCSGTSATLTASGGTGYVWSNGMTTPSITVSPLATTVYHVTVTNNSGCSDTDSVKVTVNPRPVPAIIGPTAICLGTNNAVYTTQPGMSGYVWTVSSGGTITAGSGSNSITVAWNTLGAQTVSVNYANSFGCTAAVPVSLAVTVNPMAAPTITGSSSMCVNSGFYYYSTEAGMNSYQWSVSPGATIIYGNGTKDLIVTWDQPGTQWITVNYTNSSGCTAVAPTQLAVTVNPLPGGAGAITGPSTVCAGAAGVIYTIPAIANAVTYVWSLPPGATIVSGAWTNSIVVEFSVSAQPGMITVYGNNLCGNGTLSNALQVNVSALPGWAGMPAGFDEVCEGDTAVAYWVTPVSNATTHIWEITGGGIITSGNGSNAVKVKFPSGTTQCGIRVFGANSCGQGQVSPEKYVTVNPIPPVPQVTQTGNMLFSSAAAGNQWYFNGALIPNATQQTFTPEQTGIYSVTSTLKGCSSAKSAGYYYIMTGTPAMTGLQISVYPVPNNGAFKVTMTGNVHEMISIKVINALGAVINEQFITEQLNSGRWEQMLDLRPVAPGIYTLLIESGGQRWVRKVVVDR